jgi:cob(I)alamin adenosyltransferase
MKIYTKGGDNGLTSLIGGKRVPKSDIRIEAYGTIDELIAYIGLLRDYMPDQKKNSFLLTVQDKLMTCAAILASDCDDCEVKIPILSTEDITLVEKEIDRMNNHLPELTSFILPGGHSLVSFCHIARTVCRRAERKVVEADQNNEFFLQVIRYLNRLSDYLFVLSRSLSFDLQIDEIKWIPNVD